METLNLQRVSSMFPEATARPRLRPACAEDALTANRVPASAHEAGRVEVDEVEARQKEQGRQVALRALAWCAELARGELDLEIVTHEIPLRAPRTGTMRLLRADALPEKPSPADYRALSVDEVRLHMDALMLGREVHLGLEALHDLGMLNVWLPEVASMVGFGAGGVRHKDVWEHTKIVVRQSVPRLSLRWGALFHDIGKVRTRKVDARGEVHFHGHAEVGAAMFRKRVAGRLNFEGDLRDTIDYLIYHHLRASQYDGSWTDSAVRRFYRDLGEKLDELLLLSRADITTRFREKRRRALQLIAELDQRVASLKAEDAKVPPLPKGIGSEIAARFHIPPSKRLGVLRRMLEEDVSEGMIAPGQDFSYYLQWMERQSERYGLTHTDSGEAHEARASDRDDVSDRNAGNRQEGGKDAEGGTIDHATRAGRNRPESM